MVEFDQLEEVADGAETAGVLVVEDEKQGQDQAAQEGLAGWRAAEGDEFLVEVVGEVLAEPVSQSRAWDTVLLGVLTLGERRMERVGEISNSLGGVQAGPVARLWPCGGVGDSLRGSHGSCP